MVSSYSPVAYDPSPRAAPARPFDSAGVAVLRHAADGVILRTNRFDTAHTHAIIRSVRVSALCFFAFILIFPISSSRTPRHRPCAAPSPCQHTQMVLVNLFSALSGLAEAAIVLVPALLVAASPYQKIHGQFPCFCLWSWSWLSARRWRRRARPHRPADGGADRHSHARRRSADGGGLPISVTIFYWLASGRPGLYIVLRAPLRYFMLNEAPLSRARRRRLRWRSSTRVGHWSAARSSQPSPPHVAAAPQATSRPSLVSA